MDQEQYGPSDTAKPENTTFILCFDGTGNKFSGTPADSNILKIFRMLDASDPSYHVYYQPGIGTYVQSTTYSHTSFFTKSYSWIQKTRDSMIGSSFDQHLMAGYKFLMRYYKTGDDIVIFGFSRGSYTARFLAEMLDMVGLLPPGNEEMARFAFKAFSRWQRRLGGTDEEKKEKAEMYEYMSAFRETFSRPVRRIRFLGLFDTVNSVPRFEARFMKRSKFPYTAKSSARIIRHAVAIDERRAKFRQDLLGETRPRHAPRRAHMKRQRKVDEPIQEDPGRAESQAVSQAYRRQSVAQGHYRSRSKSATRTRRESKPLAVGVNGIIEDGHRPSDQRSLATDTASLFSELPHQLQDTDDDDIAVPSDIQEIWFPGGHADIGGGWPLSEGEELPLSHAPLVWMVREAQKAGVRFRHDVMVKLKVIDDGPEATDARDYAYTLDSPEHAGAHSVPELKVEAPSPRAEEDRQLNGMPTFGDISHLGAGGNLEDRSWSVDDTIKIAAEKGQLHDCLRFGQGIPAGGVIGWKIMEWLPFARMDLQPDNSWKAIRFPLPRGEVRDIPDSALIHTSALLRMQANKSYRPGNLIVGGGGRGVIVAPEKHGIGDWDIVREKGSPIGECMMRKVPACQETNGHTAKN